MNDQEYHQLRELNWRRRLTPAEEGAVRDYLAANPEASEDWQIEAELNQFLERLPEAPAVSSNFTARVVQAVQLENAVRERAERPHGWLTWRFLHGWLPKAAVAGLAIGLFTLLSYHEHQVNTQRMFARNVAELSDAVVASDPDLMEDFDAIQRLSDPQPKADIELIALMK
jgi:hypothetical protein